MTDVVLSSGVSSKAGGLKSVTEFSGVSSETGQTTGVNLSSGASVVVGAITDVGISLKSSLESSTEAGMRVVNESSNFTSEAAGLTRVNKSSGASSVAAGTKAVAESSGASSEVTTETTAATAAAVAATTAGTTSFLSASVATVSAGWEALGPPFTGIGVLLPTDFFGLLVLALGLLPVVLELVLTSLEGVALLSLGLLDLTSAALLEVVGFLEADSALAVEADLGVSGLVVLAGVGRVSGEDVGFLVAGVDGCLLTSNEKRIYHFKLSITALNGN